MATISLAGTFYMFNVTAANATAGATYTNNGVTYYVKKTIAGGTKLYTAGAVSSTTSGTTLTKTAGVGDATITFSTVELRAHINGITTTTAGTTNYTAGDLLNLSAGQTLDYDENAGVIPGTIQAISGTPGTINIENTSTTTPIIVSLNTEASKLSSGTEGLLSIQGKWIEIATGTGGTGQTIDFSATGPMGVAIDLPVCVWVETGNTEDRYLTGNGLATPGYFKPFFNCYETTDTLAVNILTNYYGDLDHGNVFQFNRTTKLATFGNGGAVGTSNGGAVIPNGARVLFPNIHITSTVLHATVASRNEVLASQQGNVDISVASFSPNWVFGRGATNGFFGCGTVTIEDTSFCYGGLFQANIGTVTLRGVCIGMIYNAVNTTTLHISGSVGLVYLSDLFMITKQTSAGTYGMRISGCTSLREWGKTHVNYQNTAVSADRNPIYVDYLAPSTDEQLLVGPLYIIGGRCLFIYDSNIHIVGYTGSDRSTAVADTTNVNVALYLSSTALFSVKTVRAMTNGCSPRGAIISFDGAPYLCGISDVIYDARSNSDSAVTHGGARSYYANVYVPNTRTRVMAGSQLGSVKVRNSNVYSNIATQIAGPFLTVGSFQEWIMGTSGSYTGVYGSDTNAFQTVWTNNTKTAGLLSIGPLTNDSLEDSMTVVSGTPGTDFVMAKNGSLLLINSGVELQWTGKYPIRGITDFTSGTYTDTGGNENTGVTYEYAMKNPQDQTWGSWFVGTTSANWQTALSALTGYDSDIGFDLKLKITTSTANTVLYNRWFSYAGMTCTPDSTWTPAEVGFIPMTFSGAVAGSTVRLMVNTVPASPVTVRTASVAGTSDEWDFPYDFNGLSKAYRWKLRKAGYAEFNATGSTYIKGRTNGILQVLNQTVDEVAAAALTGISINGATSTVTITSNHTLNEIYDYCQWWAMQVENMGYEIPLTTTDSSTYTGVFNFTVDAGVDLTGIGNVNLGTNVLTMGAGATSTFDWAYSSTKSWTRISVSGFTANSRVRINNTTDNIELHNAVVAATSVEVQGEHTTDKVIDVRVTYVNGATAKLPFQQSANFTSSGSSVIVVQEDDTTYNTNAIDGSSVTEFAADYPNIEVDINDGDGVTSVKRLYASFQYMTHSSQGIVYFFNGITAQDVLNYQVNTAVVDLLLDNVGTLPVVIADAYLYRDDGATIIASLSPSIQMDPKRAYGVDLTSVQNMVNLIPGLF